MKRFLKEIILFSVLIGIPIIVFLVLPRVRVPNVEDKMLWCKQVEMFYKHSADEIIQRAKEKGTRGIKLGTENNSSSYLCSSPCNEGLSTVLKKALHDSHVVSEIFYSKQPIFTSEIGFLISRLINKWFWKNEVFYEKLINGKWEKMTLKPTMQELDSYNFLQVNIEIRDIKLNKKSNNFQALFSVIVDGKNIFGDGKLYEGDVTQIRWFLRQKYPLWTAYGIIGLVFIWFALSIFLPVLQIRGDLPEDVRLTTGFVLVALLACFILIYCNPLIREEARYFRSTNVFLLIDKNSEIFFEPSDTGMQKVPPSYVIRHTCENIIKNSTFESRDRENVPFLRWVWNYGLASIYTSEKYSMNRERQYPIYTFSGLKSDGNLRGVSHDESSTITETLAAITVHDTVLREGRLLVPKYELEDYIDPGTENFACMFTSASISCEDEFQACQNILKKIHQNNDVSNLKVFTVFIPTIPRTGAEYLYDFEDGKLSLASLVSDEVITLNETNYNIQEILQKMNFRTSGTLENNYKDTKCYNIKELGFAYRTKWDKPSDLTEIRNKMLLLDKKRADEGSVLIANEFLNFIEKKKEKELKKEYELVHILQNDRLGFWPIIFSVCIVGFILFSRTRNDAYLKNFNDNRVIHIVDYLETFLPMIIFILGVFLLHWRCNEPLLWTSFGYPDITFIAGILFWIFFFCGPFIIFRMWRRGVTLSSAKWWVALPACVLAGLFCWFYFNHQVEEMNKTISSVGRQHISSTKCLKTFLVVIFSAFFPLLICLKRGDIKKMYSGSIFSWWSRPWWTMFIKTTFLLCFVLVIRGLFRADTMSNSLVDYFSYSGFVILWIPIITCILSLFLLLLYQESYDLYLWLPTSAVAITLLYMIFLIALVERG